MASTICRLLFLLLATARHADSSSGTPDILDFTIMESPKPVEDGEQPSITISYPHAPWILKSSSMLLEIHAYALRKSGLMIYWNGALFVPSELPDGRRVQCGEKLTGNVHCYLRIGNLPQGVHAIELRMPSTDGTKPYGRWDIDFSVLADDDPRHWRYETLALPWGGSDGAGTQIRVRNRVRSGPLSDLLQSMEKEGFYDIHTLLSEPEWKNGRNEGGKGIVCDGDVFVDIGGHVGLSALAFATKFPKARVYVFEPIPETYEDLVWNIQANNLSHVITPQRSALVSDNEYTRRAGAEMELKHVEYSTAGSLSASKASSTWWHDHLETVTAPITSLRRVEQQFNLSAIRLLKLDCEGCEFDVVTSLAGGTRGVRSMGGLRIGMVRGEIHAGHASSEEEIARLQGLFASPSAPWDCSAGGAEREEGGVVNAGREGNDSASRLAKWRRRKGRHGAEEL